MKTAIIVVSTHHGNTRKLVDAIAAAHEVTCFDGTKDTIPDLSGFDCIGFAGGIAYSSMYPQLLKRMEEHLPEGKRVFFLYTCGSPRKGYTASAEKLARERNCSILGEYGCRGFDTFGPFRLIGGIAKGHPTADELAKAVRFYESLATGA